MAGYTYVWEFQVAPDKQAEFERHYGPDGTWVSLFRRAEGFLETRLLRDRAIPGRYLTVDRWRDAASHQRFKAEFAAEYAVLDQRLAGLSLHETPLGEFDD